VSASGSTLRFPKATKPASPARKGAGCDGFNPACTLTVSVSGGGTVTGNGIQCTQAGGDCGETYNGIEPNPPTGPRITDPRNPEPPPLTPLATANPVDGKLVAEVEAGVTGNGVVQQAAGRSLTGRAAAGISCGFNQFNCYTRIQPGQKVLLFARPQARYVFKAWTGACSGQGPRCTVVARLLQAVNAVFAPRVASPSVGFEVRPIGVNVGWARSVGFGRLVMTGSVGGPARLTVQVRRPGGGPLITRRFTANPGRFRYVLPFRKSVLPRGALILPGGFATSITGASGTSSLPYQLRPIVVPAPSEGVVRRTFTSAVQDGPATARLPKGAVQAWAHFRFATQPSTRLPVTVTWYYPSGKKLGFVKKSNRPEIVSFLKLGSGLSSGDWTAELRAGTKIVKKLTVRIG
jgi:hypothetical protein